MKTENRIVLDYAMLCALLIMMVKLMTGAIVHESLGVAFTVLAVVHLLNNKAGLKNVRKKGRFVVNILLLLALTSTVVSGMMLSVSLFRFLNIPYNEVVYTIHTSSAYALFLLSLTHLAMHGKAIADFFRKRKQTKTEGIHE
ncbi:MAG: DUF4405 domain-containing protein [Oscillospiraceae bacterium]|jgi:hypothetical protein|nr:DUF4405 domain-containing protein [Oscillospiraceae bacterium]